MDQSIRILLVEDSASDIRLAQEALKDTRIPHSLMTAHDGEEALDLLLKSENDSSKIPDLIFLDLNMPRKNGHEVLAGLKQAVWLESVPVILITVSQDEQEILRALDVKMNYYICKPVTSEKLLVLLSAIMDLSGAESEGGTTDPEDAQVRYVMAGNPYTSPRVLARLAREENANIRARVAENPHTPVDTLAVLAGDREPAVRAAVSENPNLPESILEDLVADAQDDVRLGLAGNPRLPVRILKQLTGDSNTFVVERAARTLRAVCVL